MADVRAPFFSIIIPTFRRPRQLTACLQSLAEVEHPGGAFEVLVVDDGSPEPIDKVVEPFRSVLPLTLMRQNNAGPAAARNVGAGRARGTWLVFMDDDCAPTRNYLSALARRTAAAADCAIGGRTVNVLTTNVYSTASQLLADYLYSHYNVDPDRGRFITSNNMAVPAHVFHAIGGFDATFTRAAYEDRDFCARLVRSGHRIIYAPEMVMRHAHSMTLRKYWRQHVTYGRGAASFHGRPGERGADAEFEGLSFYVNLWRYPFVRRADVPPLPMAALFFLSQLAMVVGFLQEQAARHTSS
jgi:GT2 family glycosyltransferase